MSGKKDKKTPDEEEHGRIYNTVMPSPEEVEVEKEEMKKTTPKPAEEDDDWSAVPAFLRRSRKNQE